MKYLTLALSLLSLLGSACSSAVHNVDPGTVEGLTVEYDSNDLQAMADLMIKSMLDDPDLQMIERPEKGTDQRVVLFVGNVANRTKDHIDTVAITDSIRTALVKDGTIRLATSKHGQRELGAQVDFQNSSGRTDPALINKFGKQLGADAVLLGRLMSIDKETARSLQSLGTKKNSIFYKLTLEVANVETSETIWIEEKLIRKNKTTGLFGG